MTLLEYFIYAVKLGCYRKKSWIVSAFAVVNESDSQKNEIYPGKLLREAFGLFMYDGELNKVPLQGTAKPNQAIFHKYIPITISQADFPYLPESTLETTMGRLLLNSLLIYEPFQGSIKYINQRFSPKDVEKRFTAQLVDSPPPGQAKVPGTITVDEMLKFNQAVSFTETLSSIFSSSITRAGILPPPGRKEFKKKLLVAYEGKLTDPIEMAHFQDELKKFDVAHLKEHDKSYGKFMSGKAVDARGKAFLTQGGESNSFIDQLDVTPIIGSLDNGLDLTPEAFVAAANTIRYGSFSRGAETVNGGVVAKALMTALDTWKIVDEDCGSLLGVERVFTEETLSRLLGRYVLDGKTVTLVSTLEEAKPYLNKKIYVRSQQYCRRPGTETCAICAGTAVAQYKNGQVIATMEVSSGIMKDSLKKMHTTSISTNTVDLKSILS